MDEAKRRDIAAAVFAEELPDCGVEYAFSAGWNAALAWKEMSCAPRAIAGRRGIGIEDFEKILVCDKDGCMAVVAYFDSDRPKGGWVLVNDGQYVLNEYEPEYFENPIAWMHLPEAPK